MSENVVLVFFISPSIRNSIFIYFAEFEAEVFALCDFVKEAAHQSEQEYYLGKITNEHHQRNRIIPGELRREMKVIRETVQEAQIWI